jgi:hypothetical protein
MGLEALHEVLRTLSSNTMQEVSVRIPLIGVSPKEVEEVVDRKEYTEMLSRGMTEFIAAIREMTNSGR